MEPGPGGSSGNSTDIKCVDCKTIIKNDMPRYQAFKLDEKTIAWLREWIEPQLLTEEDYICDSCNDQAMLRLRVDSKKPRSDNNSEAGPSRRRKRKRDNIECVLCCCDIEKQRSSEVLIKDKANRVELKMIRILKESIEPREMPKLIIICRPCWLLTQKIAKRMVDNTSDRITKALEALEIQESTENPQPNETPRSSASQTKMFQLPEYRRAANISSRCIFLDCPDQDFGFYRISGPSTTILKDVSDDFRALILSNHNYYIPKKCRVCEYHLSGNEWDTLFDSANSFDTFTSEQKEHISLIEKHPSYRVY